MVKGRWPLKLTKIDEPLEGKLSRTNFKILQKFDKVTLLEAFPETGRMHQIRIHAQHAGFPLVGDNKYGDRDFNDFMRAYGCQRLFLHAAGLHFSLEEKKFNVDAPLEDDLEKCLKRIK